MEKQIVLSKESSESEIKRYFNAVLELSKSDNEFPINLDEVWMLVYSERGKAIRALKSNFIEGVDYNPVAQNGNGTKFTGFDYFLSLSCLEFFIARKVRPVFEVYRKVFHGVAHQVHQVKQEQASPSYSLEDKFKAIELSCKMLRKSKSSKARMINALIVPMGLPAFEYMESEGQFLSAKDLLEMNNVMYNGKKLSSITFNKMMIEQGLMEEVESPRGKTSLKLLTAKGEKWGRNEESVEHPGSIIAKYNSRDFSGLLNFLGV